MRVLPHFLLWSVGAAPAQTQTTRRERAAIGRYASGRRRIVEIGVWHGVTTSVMRREMASEAVLYAVDPFPVGRLGLSLHRLIAIGETSKVSVGRIEWRRMTGAEAAVHHVRAGLPPVDFVFIDGDHSYDGLGEDWRGWSGLVAPGGCVALHDTQSTPERDISEAGSVRFCHDVILADPRYELVELVDSLTVIRRRTE